MYNITVLAAPVHGNVIGGVRKRIRRFGALHQFSSILKLAKRTRRCKQYKEKNGNN